MYCVPAGISVHFSFKVFRVFGQHLQEIKYLHNNLQYCDQLNATVNKFLPILFHLVSPSLQSDKMPCVALYSTIITCRSTSSKRLQLATSAKRRLFNDMAEQVIIQTYDCNSTASKCPKNNRRTFCVMNFHWVLN